MTSDRKIKANRANARASTGPHTVQGRARAARNALRHGLSLPVCSDPALSEEVEALAHEIAGTDANAEIQVQARRIAEAQIDLKRVRYVRHDLVSRALCDPGYDSRANKKQKTALTIRLVRNYCRTGDIPDDKLEFVESKLEGPQKFAAILTELAQRLAAMDRYERQAMARRKFAIRAFDAARKCLMAPAGNSDEADN